MTKNEITTLLENQRSFFESGTTLPVKFRLEMLKKLYNGIENMEAEISAALQADLGKSAFESYMCEIGMAKAELSHMLRHLRRYAAPRRVRTPLAQFAAKSFTKAVPYGSVLIMSPWNYPFLLTIGPLTDAIAAGNTAVVKPSAYAPATSAVIEKLLSACFPADYVVTVTGGRDENKALLEEKFDMIFFTGSEQVGKEVLRHAAEHLTPAVLELGGKSPCIIDATAKLQLAAKRIVFGKFLNCGQTCVAPDYILCEESIEDKLIDALKSEICAQFGSAPLENPHYGRIVNRKHFDRLISLIDPNKVAYGSENRQEALQIAPTLLRDVTPDDAVMSEEIFGPVLPILTFKIFDEATAFVRSRKKPLALYLFSEDRAHMRAVVDTLTFGGGCINDVVIHLATEEMGFGGVGESGMGSYHGKAGFLAFSHTKSIVNKGTLLDLPMRYQPYKKRHEKLLRFFLK